MRRRCNSNPVAVRKSLMRRAASDAKCEKRQGFGSDQRRRNNRSRDLFFRPTLFFLADGDDRGRKTAARKGKAGVLEQAAIEKNATYPLERIKREAAKTQASDRHGHQAASRRSSFAGEAIRRGRVLRVFSIVAVRFAIILRMTQERE